MAIKRATGQITLIDMNDVISSATKPLNPIEGTLWFDTTTNKLFVYTNGDWKFSADGLNIGARNYLKYTGVFKDTTGWVLSMGTGTTGVLSVVADTARGNVLQATKTADTGSWWVVSNSNLTLPGKKFVVGQQYTVSFMYKSDFPIYVNFKDGNGTNSVATDYQLTAQANWTRAVWTFKATATGNAPILYIAKGSTANGTFQLDDVMLEEGNIPSSWSAAPEETQGQIDTINDSLDALGNDGKITRFERSLIRGYIADIVGTYLLSTDSMPSLATIDNPSYNKGKLYSIRQQAIRIGLDTTKSANYKPLGDAYTALVTYLSGFTPKPWDTTSTGVITLPDRTVWNSKWNDYYNYYTLFEIEVQDRQKAYSDIVGGQSTKDAIASISTAGNHDSVPMTFPTTTVTPPIATLGLPEFEGNHVDSWNWNVRNNLRNGDFSKGTAYFNVSSASGFTSTVESDPTYGKIFSFKNTGALSSVWRGISQYFKTSVGIPTFYRGDVITISFMYRINTDVALDDVVGVEIKGLNGAGTNINAFPFASIPKTAPTGVWTKYTSTATCNQDICDNPYFSLWIRQNGSMSVDNIKVERGTNANPVFTPAPEDAWNSVGNRIRPVTNPTFSSGTALTLYGKFYGDGVDNDKFYWDTNGSAIKIKRWVDVNLDSTQNWTYSSNQLSVDGVNRVIKSSCVNEYPMLFDDTISRPNKTTLFFGTDYVGSTCTDYTDAFYQLGTTDATNMHGFFPGESVTFSLDLNSDVTGTYISMYTHNGTSWTENKGTTQVNVATWERITSTFTIPVGTKGVMFRIQHARVATSNTKIIRFRKVQIEKGGSATAWSVSNTQTIKLVKATGFASSSLAVSGTESAVKNNGSYLVRKPNIDAANQVSFDTTNNTLYISIADADSGWGSAYTPTADEVKAYLIGWTLCNGTWNTSYTGTGDKIWYPIGDKDLSRATKAGNTAPVDPSPSISDKSVDYYQLVYKITDAIQETVDFDGILELLATSNVVSIAYPDWTPAITKGSIKYGTNLATVAQDTRYIIPAMQKRVTNIEQKVTSDSIVNTVTNSTEYTLALKNKANAGDLSNYATRNEMNGVAGSVDSKISGALAGIDFSPYVTRSELKQTSTDITAKFSASGGMNLIKNSIGFSVTNNKIDFWNDWSATKVLTTMSTALDMLGFGKGFYFKADGQNKGITQDVSVIPGQPYTLSWYLNKMTKGADSTYRFYIQVFENNVLTTQIADNSGTQTNGFSGSYMTFTPTTDKVNIRFVGYSNVEAILSGIMLNIGDIALQWSLATGELYNSAVRMNVNGLRVSQFDANSNEIGFTQMTPTEFAGYYQNNGAFERVFYLNGDETVTKKIRATNEITLGNVKILNITSAANTGWAFVPNSN